MLRAEVGTLSEVLIAYQHGKPVVVPGEQQGWAGRLRQSLPEEGAYLDGRRLARVHNAIEPEVAW